MPLFQCADGLGPRIRKEEEVTGSQGESMEESVRLELQDLSPTALKSTLGIQDPLNRVLGLGYTSTSPEDLEQQREMRFIRVWNDLSRKNITHNYDSLEILANLLELRAGDLLGMSTKTQMKAVLGSHRRLPVDLLSSSTKRNLDAEEDRWIPRFPKGGEPLREQSTMMDVTPAGLLLRSKDFGNEEIVPQGCSIMVVEVTKTSGLEWSLSLPNTKSEVNRRISVSLRDTDDNSIAMVSSESREILVLDISSPAFQTARDQDRPGFCLIEKERTQNVISTSYVCPVLWGPSTPDLKPNQFSADICGDILESNSSRDILIASDIASWPRLSARQNLFLPSSFSHNIKAALVVLLYIPALFILGSISHQISPSTDKLSLLVIISIILGLKHGILFCAQWATDICVQRANDYLQLQSFTDEWKVEEPVLERLSKALAMDGGISPLGTRIAVVVLKWMLWLWES